MSKKTETTHQGAADEQYVAFASVSAMMENFTGGIIIQVAMDEELAPFLSATDEAFEPFEEGAATFYPRYLKTDSNRVPLLLVRSKIGLVNAASAITEALGYISGCRGVLAAGTAGGLAPEVNVGDIVIGDDYTYTDADASIFGYVRGQVPGMPESYRTGTEALAAAARSATEALDEQRVNEWQVRTGRMLAGNSFVTDRNVADTREVFPGALSTDMESTAIAQVCANYSVPFMAVRCVSDLCGPAADQEFHMSVDVVAPRSARYALQVALALWSGERVPALKLGI